MIRLVAIIGLFATLAGCFSGYSNGERDGYITKFSRKGIFCKTWEGELQLGAGANAALQEPWEFSATDETAEDVQRAMGKHVRITYDQWFPRTPICGGDSGYRVVGVKVL